VTEIVERFNGKYLIEILQNPNRAVIVQTCQFFYPDECMSQIVTSVKRESTTLRWIEKLRTNFLYYFPEDDDKIEVVRR